MGQAFPIVSLVQVRVTGNAFQIVPLVQVRVTGNATV